MPIVNQKIQMSLPSWVFAINITVRRKLTQVFLVGKNFRVFRDRVVLAAVTLQTMPSPESVAFHGWCVVFFSCTNNSTPETKLASYINSRKWADLEEALLQSTNSPFDHLVGLRLESPDISGPQLPGVEFITFRNMNAIPNLLQPRPGDHSITTIGPREITGGSDRAITGQVAVTDGIAGTGDLTGYQRVDEASGDSAGGIVDIGDGEGLKAGLVIERAVRRYFLKQTERSLNDKLKIGYHFEACKKFVHNVHAGYRMIYLGPVPHLLLCLEWIISCAQESKDTIKARCAKATLQKLSDLTSQQTQIRLALWEVFCLSESEAAPQRRS